MMFVINYFLHKAWHINNIINISLLSWYFIVNSICFKLELGIGTVINISEWVVK